MKNYDFTQFYSNIVHTYDDFINNNNYNSSNDILMSNLLNQIPQTIVESLNEYYPNFFKYTEKNCVLNIFSLNSSDTKSTQFSLKDEVLLDYWLYEKISQYKSCNNQSTSSLQDVFIEAYKSLYRYETDDKTNDKNIVKRLNVSFVSFAKSNGLLDFLFDIGIIDNTSYEDFSSPSSEIIVGNKDLLSLLLPFFGLTNINTSFLALKESVSSLERFAPYNRNSYNQDFLANIAKYFAERFYSFRTYFSLSDTIAALMQNKSLKYTTNKISLNNGDLYYESMFRGCSVCYSLRNMALPFLLPYVSLQENALTAFQGDLVRFFVDNDTLETYKDVFHETSESTFEFCKHSNGLTNSINKTSLKIQNLLQKSNDIPSVDISIFSSTSDYNDSIYIELTKLLLSEDPTLITNTLRDFYDSKDGLYLAACHICILEHIQEQSEKISIANEARVNVVSQSDYDKANESANETEKDESAQSGNDAVTVSKILAIYAYTSNIIFCWGYPEPLEKYIIDSITIRFKGIAFLHHQSALDNDSRIISKPIVDKYTSIDDIRRNNHDLDNYCLDHMNSKPYLIFNNPDVILKQIKVVLQITTHIYQHILSRMVSPKSICSILEDYLRGSVFTNKKAISQLSSYNAIDNINNPHFNILWELLNQYCEKYVKKKDVSTLFLHWMATKNRYIWSDVNSNLAASVYSDMPIEELNSSLGEDGYFVDPEQFDDIITELIKMRLGASPY